MMTKVEEIIEKIKKSIDDPDVIEIFGIEKSYSAYSYDNFFGNCTYTIYRKRKVPGTPTGYNIEALTSFQKESFVEGTLEYLRQEASNKLPKGDKFEVYNRGTSTWTQTTPPNFDDLMKIAINPANKDVVITRIDTNLHYKFNSMEELIAEVFPKDEDSIDDKWCQFQKGIAKALNEYAKTSQKSLKSAMSQVKNAQERIEILNKAIDKVPDSIKLLLAIDWN